MNSFTKFARGALAALTLLACCIPAARAQQYSATTLYSFEGTDTNVVAQVTNINAQVTATKWGDFDLEVRFTGTNAAMTTTLGYSVAWSMSEDGTNWGTVIGRNKGWFSIPTTNAITTVWTTNISMASCGFYRIEYLTNSSGQCITNFSAKAWKKPNRNG